MAIRADLPVYIKIIQQHKFPGESMLIGSDLLPKQYKTGVAIALGHIAQHLVIGPVFFNDIKDMFDRRRIPYLSQGWGC